MPPIINITNVYAPRIIPLHVHISLIVPLDSARDSEEKDNPNILLYFLAKRFNLHIHLLKRTYQIYKFNIVPSKPVQ